MIIIIPIDYTRMDCISYEDMKFFISTPEDWDKYSYTNVLDFFCFDTLDKGVEDVIVRRISGQYISTKELLNHEWEYTKKDIRRAHNIRKLLVAGHFNWRDGK